MKRLNKWILFILILTIFSPGFAQSKFDKSSIKVSNRVYICKSVSDRIYVHNKANKELGRMKVPSGSDNITSINFSDLNKLIPIFNTVFTKAQLKDLLPEKEMIIQFEINDTGKILYLLFDLSKDTQISPKELSELEDSIKSKIDFSFYNNELEGANFIRFNFIVRFKKIYNRGTLIRSQ